MCTSLKTIPLMEGSWGSAAEAHLWIATKRGTRGRLALPGAPCCPEGGDPSAAASEGAGEPQAAVSVPGHSSGARQVGPGAAGPGTPRGDEMSQWQREGAGPGRGRRWHRKPGGEADGAEEGGPQPRAPLAAIQLQALPCPGPSAAIEMEMPRAGRMETLFPA